MRPIDHLVVAARTLEEGDAWIREKLGVATRPGGTHDRMGTHNRVLRLRGMRYLEVIAIDPGAPAPSRPRWFALDTAAMQERLAGGPALIHWVEPSGNIEDVERASGGTLKVESFTRGPYRWRMAFTPDGSLPGGGTQPYYIQWDSEHPTQAMPQTGITLDHFEVGNDGLWALFSTPSGRRTLP